MTGPEGYSGRYSEGDPGESPTFPTPFPTPSTRETPGRWPPISVESVGLPVEAETKVVPRILSVLLGWGVLLFWDD